MLNNKFFILSALLIVAGGCANQKTNPGSPAVRDQLVKETPAFIADSTACKKQVYAEGIEVEGVRIYDAAIIEKYQHEYTSWINKTFVEPAGANNTGATTEPADNKNASVQVKQEAIPEKFSALEKLRVKYDQCMIARGWRNP